MAAIRTFLAALTLRDVPKMRSGRVSPENPTATCHNAPGSWPSAFTTDYDNYILPGEFSRHAAFRRYAAPPAGLGPLTFRLTGPPLYRLPHGREVGAPNVLPSY